MLSISDAAATAAISRTELYRKISSKKIRAQKMGRRTLVVAESLRAYLAGLPAAEINVAAR